MTGGDRVGLYFHIFTLKESKNTLSSEYCSLVSAFSPVTTPAKV